MIEKLLKLYVTSMSQPGGVRSPMPHLFGPPGSGKSSMVGDLAKLVGHNMHIINVSRISPLELEGVQMPDKENTKLTLLTATFWSQLEEGDILMLDEFLRGFPEVYNGMLDILTSREVGGYKLPKVFIIGASNTTVSYDPALEDRLLHLKVPDPRRNHGVQNQIKQRIIDSLGLYQEVLMSDEMDELLEYEILPMYDVLDSVGPNRKPNQSATMGSGRSIRNLIGQAQLREVQSKKLKDLLAINNTLAMRDGRAQFVFLTSGHGYDPRYPELAERIKGNKKLTEVQAHNLSINLQLIEMENARRKKEDQDDDLFPLTG